MNRLVKMIGIVCVCVFMYSIPILTTCAIIFEWNALVRFLLLSACTVQMFLLMSEVWDDVEDGE